MFDISSKSVAETHDVEIIDPTTNEPLLGEGGRPCSVTVYGPGSKAFAAARTVANNRAVKRLKARGKADTTPEEEAAAKATFLTSITVSFNNFGYKGMEDGPEAWRACYLDQSLGFIADKVNQDAGDWGNFSPASSTS